MEQIGIYNAREVEGLAELLATIDCELGENEHFLIVVNNQEVANDDGLESAMISALGKGAKIIVVWPPTGPNLPLPEILRKIRKALIKFDAEALHEVICKKIDHNDGPGGGQQPAPRTDRHCC